MFGNMSRIGNLPIPIPQNVTVETSGRAILVKGPEGTLEMETDPKVKVEIKDNQVIVSRKREDRFHKSMHGLTRTLIANMVTGVNGGWQKKLELIGVGFRAQTNGEKLTLNVGFSHPVEIVAPPGIKFAVEENTKITVLGIDKSLVGEVAAKIRSVRPPEPYKGKGIRVAGEYVRRKAGKAGKVGAGAK
ncbi:MAG: 50S ribosomal protein L6 [Candidatus Daviesbacteria bacterium GW2011_GWB1_41_5]|uniref:Large ribosomal subunit protein uL6 n=2 Tax=Candidatus Daviesiibacteriota TaxID=1752718 RepID=A0A0G0YTR6_9BACT|nr:MAG: 50S ribosomal protein L6 [Candidatus Daviesbacteria bacterium GW2011_GWB1_41_5]